MSRICLTGCGGFIGSHLCTYLKERGHYVKGIDIKKPEFSKTTADEFVIQDLRYPCPHLFQDIDEVYHLAANMGGISFIENNKCSIVFDNTVINMLTIKACQEMGVKKFLFSSSACIYPKYLQTRPEVEMLKEEHAYPADAEDGYGWEKLMMERTCRHFGEETPMKTYVARFHNIYGPEGTYDGGREKSPAALCRKIARAQNGKRIEVWGDGTQTRSYCYIDDCVEALYALMNSDYHEPLNIGTDELVSIDELILIIENISEKNLLRDYDLTKPQGVKGRNADISKIYEVLGWQPKTSLTEGIRKTYEWINSQVSQ